jgi:hypothetical protein
VLQGSPDSIARLTVSPCCSVRGDTWPGRLDRRRADGCVPILSVVIMTWRALAFPTRPQLQLTPRVCKPPRRSLTMRKRSCSPWSGGRSNRSSGTSPAVRSRTIALSADCSPTRVATGRSRHNPGARRHITSTILTEHSKRSGRPTFPRPEPTVCLRERDLFKSTVGGPRSTVLPFGRRSGERIRDALPTRLPARRSEEP